MMLLLFLHGSMSFLYASLMTTGSPFVPLALRS